ncbi:MAG: nodulation protein NfeD [Bacteroidota bacterium]|nr:nodulation protein NfeD [Bacteroidota bacterium]MDP4190621.1 nodulation protein NfeD [Bacteroidota bacterium]MDP4195134.1 nodulation protein NfeD [Bacteroidota bacterium]
MLLLLFLLVVLLPLPSPAKTIYILSTNGTINPVSESYLVNNIGKASENRAECVIIKLNTPGGLLSSTRNIVSAILRSPVPIIVYVSPEGAQAASAGVFITLSAHVAAMAQSTNIGAAHPVSLQGSMDSIMFQKSTNDAAAFIRTISKKRNRNVQWAEDAVRKSLSITENEALKMNVINIISKDLNELLRQINGVEVETTSGKRKIDTEKAQLVYIDMNFRQKFLDIICDPNIAYIFLMLGFYGLIFELYNPGAIFPGVIGAISLILAFYSLNTLPVNYAALLLIILSIVLFILEIKIVSHGLLTIGGVIMLALGSIMLFDTGPIPESLSISKEIIFGVVGFTTVFFLFVITLGIKAQHLRTSTGPSSIIGEIAIALSDLNPFGQVSLHGEIWSAENLGSDIISKGENVEIVNVRDLDLMVRKCNHAS